MMIMNTISVKHQHKHEYKYEYCDKVNTDKEGGWGCENQRDRDVIVEKERPGGNVSDWGAER